MPGLYRFAISGAQSMKVALSALLFLMIEQEEIERTGAFVLEIGGKGKTASLIYSVWSDMPLSHSYLRVVA
ncbi:uncharacterized protein PHACADRAFT_165271 [Phanerochaete carnosa HHB-10118-sp]|uniref:Uncharacterized protein n=1 Tax=Phanerochaete carnosa (strain HHB-10118-sp) TaxID=650164 RepID=K5VKL8_PHACS|nr:uncharacterized protein PHACADRAFT_165271 [Phanerochaete carnosa HHB-10118-sp]EKM51938.1 hypothetical protein PHACADRAFT_165271 [Phanerochaete carnosa HHB-10118-sp]